MSLGEYIKAKRLGEVCYREHLNEGSYPYLQILDEILNHVTIVSETVLKETEIPMDRIRGTFAAGRRTAFAANFMPLLDDTTEFGEKWSFLYDSLKKEGIRDPVKCYEYMNHYYIIEGNKRVSVMKYLGADSIPARVTRLVPRFEESKAHISYYEYLDFYKKCPENYMVFTEPGAYTKFNWHVRKSADHVWTDEEIKDLKSRFYKFKFAYRSLFTSEAAEASLSDSFLAYLNVYPYQDILNKSSDQIKDELLSMEEELKLQETGKNVRLVLEEDTAPRRGLFNLFSSSGTGSKMLRIAFIHDADVQRSDWIYQHELGKNHLANYFGKSVYVTSYYNVDPFRDIYDILTKCGKDGYDIVFTTSRMFLDASLAVAVRYPKTRYLCCTLNSAHRYVRSYYTRTYEVYYLSGIIAGTITDDDKIGYICSIPVPESLSNLNAFALGVQMIRPSARIYVQWSQMVDSDPQEFFRKNNIHLISGRAMMNLGSGTRDYGLYDIRDGKLWNVAMPVSNWGRVYQKIVESVQNGAYEEAADNADGLNALNYWWGLSTECVELFYTTHIQPQTIKMIDNIKNSFKDGIVPVFSGKINSLTGPITTEYEEYLMPEDIINMHWLLDNIVCEFPDFNKMTPAARISMLSHINN